MKNSTQPKRIIHEELDAAEIKEVKRLIKAQLLKLFYALYVKKNFWSSSVK